MTKVEKLIDRFKQKPKDFSFDELRKLLGFLGYQEKQGAGSRVVFVNEKLDHKIKLHKPHPENILKRYQVDLISKELAKKRLL
ncbi:type II toxin-antitoxin system HicA family toxin [Maribellus sediminis]|uniref:type II toxin-antitoxin system HicA family toxin n=1 Tax=Maribellus sediminis TaxID=2696285 RepID=UPI00142F917F|nr:type II toxin-antitoxin system HicA family toxin [Maribellus sediminis]